MLDIVFAPVPVVEVEGVVLGLLHDEEAVVALPGSAKGCLSTVLSTRCHGRRHGGAGLLRAPGFERLDLWAVDRTRRIRLKFPVVSEAFAMLTGP